MDKLKKKWDELSPFFTFEEIQKDILELSKLAGKKNLVVAAANEKNVIKASIDAYKLGLIEINFFGDKKIITKILKEENFKLTSCTIFDYPDSHKATMESVKFISEGNGDFLMKGLVHTGTYLKAILNEEHGLRRKKGLLSHVAIFQPTGFKRLFLMSDAAMIIEPTLQQKIDILKNAVYIAEALGINTPKVAMVCAVETVNTKMPSTLDAAIISKMSERGQLGINAVVDGPLAADVALSEEKAKIKKLTSEVAGHADVCIMHRIEDANVFYKLMELFGGGNQAGILAGAKKPVILPSRGDDDRVKLNSILVGTMMSYYEDVMFG
ncbi:phosphate butyryltransferase [Candidatus Dependentiae bacterium]|nr:phosphate butyryltransferase [Candidatus Dependentiae bacterium]